jgi:hypothetical protein
MKFLLLLSLIISSVSAQAIEVIDKVKSFDVKDDGYYVEFVELGKMIVPKDNPSAFCLENAWKSQMKVVLEVDEHHGYIDKCMLFNGPPGTKPVHPNKLRDVIEKKK